jgi:hypothetical protein
MEKIMSEDRLNKRYDMGDVDVDSIFDGWDVYSAISRLTEFVTNKIEKDKENFPDATYKFEYCCGYESYPALTVWRYWTETDQEYNERTNMKEMQDKKNRETRYKNFLKLKEEFEP